jgi:methionyl-tRNA formyltransferase
LAKEKDMSDFSIVFMGTPEFAVHILDEIVKSGTEIKAVVTAPDKPAGRGLKIQESAVKQYALEAGLPILQPTNLKDPIFLEELQRLHADMFVVVAFRMLPESVWNMPPKGTINLHASLLPQYRGAAPINWAIINGEHKTGVTTFFLQHEIDTGAVIEQNELEIGSDETVGELYLRLMNLGGQTVLSTLEKVKEDRIIPIEQKDLIKSDLKAAPKIFREDCKIDCSKTAEEVHNKIRGLSPYPAAWIEVVSAKDGQTRSWKLFKSERTTIPSSITDPLQADEAGILIPCLDNYIRITELQPEGKRRMNFKEFMAGNSLSELKIKV